MGGHALHGFALAFADQAGANRGHSNLKTDKKAKYRHGDRKSQAERRELFGAKHRDIKGINQLKTDNREYAPGHRKGQAHKMPDY